MLCLVVWSSPCTGPQLTGWDLHTQWWQSSKWQKIICTHAKGKITYITAFSTVFNLQLNIFNFPTTFQSCGSACKKEHSFHNYRVTIKYGCHIGSEPERATGIFNLWLSKVNVLKTQNYTISLSTGFFTGSRNILPPNHDIPAFSGTKLMTIPFSAELIKTAGMHKYQEWTIVSAWQIITHSKTLLIQN